MAGLPESRSRGPSRAPSLLVALVLGLGLGLACGACTRTPAHQRTRAGTAIALETRHTAATIAEAIVLRADPACGVYPVAGPMTVETTWVVEGERDGALVLELEETRRLEIDAAERVRYLRSVEFRTEHGRTGERTREWRLIDGHLYTREVNLPFERRQADAVDRDDLLDQPRQVFETLVQATGPRWRAVQRVESGWQVETTRGADRGLAIGCGRQTSADPWLRHLLARAEVRDGLARVGVDAESGAPVTRSGSWTIEPLGTASYRLRVAVEERIAREITGEPIEPPESVFDSTRARPLDTLSRFLQDLDAVTPSEGSGRASLY